MAACLAGRPAPSIVIVERHRRDGVSAVLPVRRQPRGRERSDAGRLPARLSGLAQLQGQLVARHVAVPDRRERLPEPGQRSRRRRASRSTRGSTSTNAASRLANACCAASAPAQVRAAIAQLPRKQRAALILRMYHDMSHQEIADALGSSVGAVKANVFHALQNLKKLLRRGSRAGMRHLSPEQLIDLAEGDAARVVGAASRRRAASAAASWRSCAR